MVDNEKNANLLFGVLAYTSVKEYDEFVSRLSTGNKNDLLITIQSAIRYSLSSGLYTLEESEVLSITLRKIMQILNNDSTT